MNSIDIAIVGAGPAGLSAAIELSKMGHNSLTVFEREEEVGGAPRHCGHLGFGIAEFGNLLTGPKYAKKLSRLANEQDIDIRLHHTLTKVEDKVLTFSTPKGVVQYSAQRIIFALGAREIPRASRLISGARGASVMTTGALQRFVYMHGQAPFQKAVIIGSEIVGFSALMTARHAGVDIPAIIEPKDDIDAYKILKPLTRYILQTEVLTQTKIIKIEGVKGTISGITIEQDGVKRTIECDGIIFSGDFTPESAILAESLDEFNHTNNSCFITENYQTKNSHIFLAGNVIRGALAAFKCYAEGKKVATSLHNSLKEDKETKIINISVSDNIQWYQPSLINLDSTSPTLTTIRTKHRAKGVLKVTLNDQKIWSQTVTLYPFVSFDIPRMDVDFSDGDRVYVEFLEG